MAAVTPRNVLDLMRGVPRQRVKRAAKIGEPWHGTVGGYSNHGCRCARCRKAYAKAMRDYLDRHPEQRDKARERERRRYWANKGQPPPPRPEQTPCPHCGRGFTRLERHMPFCKVKPEPIPITHGTEAGYKRCLRRPQGACNKCRAAATESARRRRRQRR